MLTKDFVSCVHVHFYERDSCVADTLNFLTGNITFSEIENEKSLVFGLLSPREGLGYGEIGGWVWGVGGGGGE